MITYILGSMGEEFIFRHQQVRDGLLHAKPRFHARFYEEIIRNSNSLGYFNILGDVFYRSLSTKERLE